MKITSSSAEDASLEVGGTFEGGGQQQMHRWSERH